MLLSSELHALVQVVFVDIVLAGDNAIVVGMVAASVPPELRKKVILLGIFAATVMRIVFSLGALQLLEIIGLMLAGGLLLLWVGWKLWLEIRLARNKGDAGALGERAATEPKTFGAAVFQIVLADVSMSLDNVLAVSGAARHHTWVLVFGLAMSVALMAFASTYVANLLKLFHWIAYSGLLVIFYIATTMIWEGAHQVYSEVLPATPSSG